MRYLSVCSGIEAASVAWEPLGWEPVAFSEVDKFPSRVLAHRFPNTPNWGDMTKFQEWPDATFDVLVGGTPCQSFSIAGLRKGLADPRGNLMLTYLAIAGRYRPRWLVWENVPGVLSSNGGRDFGTFLAGLAELGYHAAWRILDAQFVRVDGFGRAVPQRRRRVFVVGYSGDWRRPAQVLLEPSSLRGDPAPRRQAGERPAPTISARTSGGGGLGTDFDCDGGLIPQIANPLTARMHKGVNTTMDEGQTMVAHSLRAEGFDAGEDGTGRGTPLVPVAYRTAGDGAVYEKGDRAAPLTTGTDPSANIIAIQERAISENPNAGPDGMGVRQDGAAYTLEARQVPQAVAFQPRFVRNGRGAPDEIASALTAEAGRTGKGDSAQVVAFDTTQVTSPANRSNPQPGDPCHPLAAAGHPPAIISSWAVRRLTPTECEKLQGFPEVTKSARINVWHSSDLLQTNALAEIQSRKSPKSALSAVESGSPQTAEPAEQASVTSRPNRDLPVALHVRIDFVQRVAAIHSAGRLIWSANIADAESVFLPHMPSVDFARLVVHLIGTEARITLHGKAGQQQSTTPSMDRLNGSGSVNVFGQEIEELAADAAMFTETATAALKSTTSQSGPSSQNSGLRKATSSSCVAAAITTFIPTGIRQANSYAVIVEEVRGWTDIGDGKGKPTPDGPRYKALGNSMACNVMRWIGRRIDMVEELYQQKEAAE